MGVGEKGGRKLSCVMFLTLLLLSHCALEKDTEPASGVLNSNRSRVAPEDLIEPLRPWETGRRVERRVEVDEGMVSKPTKKRLQNILPRMVCEVVSPSEEARVPWRARSE